MTQGLTAFTRMTRPRQGDAAAPAAIVAAVEGICAGAGAIIAMASDIRLLPQAQVRVPVQQWACRRDMGACAILPRIIGQSRASELLYTGRFMTPTKASAWGSSAGIVTPEHVLPQAQQLARQIAEGRPSPTP